MAFPQVLVTKTQRNTEFTTTHPTPTITTSDVSNPTPGDLILWFFVISDIVPITWPTSLPGMTDPVVLGTWPNSAGNTNLAIAYTTVTEAVSSYGFAVTTGTLHVSATLAYYVRGWTNVYVSSAATGNSTTPNPPSLTPAGGRADYLWIPAAIWPTSGNTPTAPTNYTNLVWATTNDNSSYRRVIATARRFLNAASEDPGTFSIGGGTSRSWVAVTLAVRGPSVTTLTIAPATTTATPLTPSRRKYRAVNPAAPQAAAVTPGRYKRRAVGAVTAQAVAVTLGRRKRRVLDAAAAQAEALSPVRRQHVLIGAATIQATAKVLGRRKLRAVNVAAAQTAAVALGQRKFQAIGVAGVQSASLTPDRRKFQAADPAASQTAAAALAGRKRRVLDVAAAQTASLTPSRRKLRVIEAPVVQLVAVTPGRHKLRDVYAAIAQTAAVTPGRRKLRTVDAAAAQATAVELVQRQSYLLIDPAAIQAMAMTLGRRKSRQVVAARVVAEAHWLNGSPSAPPPSGGAERFDPVLFATRGVIRLRRGVAI
jgi:hypothetical protein